MWTSHTYKSIREGHSACAKTKSLLVVGQWNAEVKPLKKSNPKGWVYTDHTNVILNPSKELLSKFKKSKQLVYDKRNIEFNLTSGEYLLFDDTGCHVLEVVE